MPCTRREGITLAVSLVNGFCPSSWNLTTAQDPFLKLWQVERLTLSQVAIQPFPEIFTTDYFSRLGAPQTEAVARRGCPTRLKVHPVLTSAHDRSTDFSNSICIYKGHAIH